MFLLVPAHVQRIACLYITGAIRTAPTAALELVIGITPVMVYVEQEVMAACLHLKLNSQWIQTHTGFPNQCHRLGIVRCVLSAQT